MSDDAQQKPEQPMKRKKRNVGGRPSKFSEERAKRMFEALRIGSYIEAAAAYGGIDKVTLYSWMKKGNEQKSGQFREFLNGIEKAMEEGELFHVQNIARHAQGDERSGIKSTWQASAWMLERKFPKKWGRKEIVKNEDESEKDSAFNEESINAILVKTLDGLEDDRWED